MNEKKRERQRKSNEDDCLKSRGCYFWTAAILHRTIYLHFWDKLCVSVIWYSVTVFDVIKWCKKHGKKWRTIEWQWRRRRRHTQQKYWIKWKRWKTITKTEKKTEHKWSKHKRGISLGWILQSGSYKSIAFFVINFFASGIISLMLLFPNGFGFFISICTFKRVANWS